MTSTQARIVHALRKIGRAKCLEKANKLENSSGIRNLHLRSLDLTASDIIAITSCFMLNDSNVGSSIESISFSYNSSMGNEGVIALAKKLPPSIREIGLVDCGITDQGGIALLEWMKKAPHLRMVCIEENDFSVDLRRAFQQFRIEHAKITVIY
jgi:hypothetical protein